METAVLFADISGFTMLGEACAKQGVRGNEELAFCINRYMEGMVKILGKYGGDIIKFVGDALIVMWPEEKEKGPESASNIVRKAIQCALDIQKEMNNFQVITGVSALSVKIGLGYGKCALLYVGGVFNRAEFFTVGSALTYALKSEGQAEKGGQILVSETAFKHVSKLYKATEKISHVEGKDPGGEKFYLIEKLIGEGVKTRADALAIRGNISNETYNKISTQLKGCVPAAIIPYLQIGAESFGSETRSLTVMFASLGVELSSAETEQGMQLIQKIVTCVQQAVYRHQGSVNKLVMDDKGSTLVCLWGLSPMSHDDDASRAILTAFEMRRELMRLYQTTCNIGISSGEMFSGVVGTSGGRKEFSVLGDVANLAARIMYWPIKRKMKGKIHVDFNTKTLASNQLSFNYVFHSEFKGKSISIPIFEPVLLEDELDDITKKMLMPGIFLKPHMNPLNLERSLNNTITKLKIFGEGQDSVQDIKKEIIDYFQLAGTRPYLASIKGEIGSGKTLFARCLIEELCTNDEFKQMMLHKNQLFCSSINQETQYKFLNIWRPILVQLLTYYCRRDKFTREQTIQQIMLLSKGGCAVNQKYTEVLCDIFQADTQKVYQAIGSSQQAQVTPIDRVFPFVQRANYTNKTEILNFAFLFLQMVLGEIQINQQPRMPDQTPIVLVLDTVHLMDSPSWEFFAMIRDQCKRIGVVLLQRCDDMGELIIHTEAQQTFQEVWYGRNMENLHQIELPCLNSHALRDLLKSMAQKYQATWSDEMMKMTDIEPDPYYPEGEEFHTIKDKQMGDQWKIRLTSLWQLKDKFQDIETQIVDVIIRRCHGNPLLCLNFFVLLLQNGFIQIESSGLVVSTQKFNECIKLNDFLSCPAPRISIKQNLAMIDKYVHSVYSKGQKLRPGELDLCMQSTVLMKAATVLGDEFDTKSLQAMYPLRSQESIQHLNKMLKLLEENQFIEVLDESDKDQNYKCRFNKPFLRESIYQVVLFRDQKQGIHGAAASYLLQNQVDVIGRSQNPEILVDILKKHMLIAEDVKEENELSFQSRTGLTVNRIKNKLFNDPKGYILNENIYKQGQGANKKTSKRLCTIDNSNFRWYHDEKELKAGTYLGSVPIQYIFQTVSSKMAWMEKPSFSISTTQWFDKHETDQGKRDFYFACDDQVQMEKWIITIEFLRTKAVYDAYLLKNIPVQFPAIQQQQKKIQHQTDYSDISYEFGVQLKQKTQIRFNLNTSQILQTSKITRDSRAGDRQTPKGNQTDLVQKIKTLYQIGILSFSHHLKQTSCKITVKQQSAQLGQLPDKSLQNFNDKINTIFDDPRQNLRDQNTSFTVEETCKEKLYKRRGSSISADQLTITTDVAQNIKKVNDLIHEESEGQTSEEVKIVPKVAQSFRQQARRSCMVQDTLRQGVFVNVAESENARQTNESASSPPLSINQNMQMIAREQHDNVNRQTFAPQTELLNSQRLFLQIENPVALFNQDERLDNLTQNSSPGEIITKSEQKIELHQKEDTNFQSQSTQYPKRTQEDQLLKIQDFLKQSIEQGVQRLMQHNEAIVNAQKEELSNLVVYQHQQLMNQTQSMVWESPMKLSFHQNFESHAENPQFKKLSQSNSKARLSGGVTSQKYWLREQNNDLPSSKHNDNDQDPQTPSPSPSPDRNMTKKNSIQKLISQQNRENDQQSTKTLKREYNIQNLVEYQYQQFEQPARSRKLEQVMKTEIKPTKTYKIFEDESIETKHRTLKMVERMQKKKRRKTASII